MNLPCQEFVEFLSDYLDDALPEPRQAIFDQHLRECTECVDYLSSFRNSIELGKLCADQDAQQVSNKVPEALIAAVLASRKS